MTNNKVETNITINVFTINGVMASAQHNVKLKIFRPKINASIKI